MADPSTPAQLIEELKIVPELSTDKVSALARISEVVRFTTGDVVFREAASHDFVYWVYRGRISIKMAAPGQASVPLLTVGAGELLAWSSFFKMQRMTATGTAACETILLGFKADALNELCEQDNEIGYLFTRHLAWGLSRRLVATRLQLLDLFNQPARSVE